MVTDTTRVAFLGAGLCGLTAARALARSGVEVIVLEGEKEVGGLARTVKRDGCQVDLGSHRLHPDAFQGELRFWLEELCHDILTVRPRKGRLRFCGRYIPYPPSLFGLLGSLGFRRTFKCFEGWIKQKVHREYFDPPPNYESYIVSKVGREAYCLFYRPYAVKVWRVDPTLISVDEVKKRVVTSSPFRAAIEALRRLGTRQAGDEPTYLYPKGGIGMIARRLADDIKRHGGRLETDVRLRRLGVNKSGLIDTVVYEKGGNTEAVPVSAAAGTVTLQVLCSLLKERCPDDVSDALGRLYWRSLRLFYWQPPGLGQEGCETLYFPELNYQFGRISVPGLFNPGMGAPSGGELICVELPCDENDAIWNASDREILGLILPSLEQSEVVKPGVDKDNAAILFSEWIQHAYPMLCINWRSNFEKAYFWLRRFANLYPIGRQGLFLHNNMDQSILLGLTWAQEFLQSGPINPKWDEDISRWSNWKIRD